MTPPSFSRDPLKYLSGYPEQLQMQVYDLIEQGRLGTILAEKYGQTHTVRSDGQLRDYVQALKDRHLRKSAPLSKVIYDSKLQVMKHALGTHTTISRVQGNKLKVSREIRAGPGILDSPISVRLPLNAPELALEMEQENESQKEKKPLG